MSTNSASSRATATATTPTLSDLKESKEQKDIPLKEIKDSPLKETKDIPLYMPKDLYFAPPKMKYGHEYNFAAISIVGSNYIIKPSPNDIKQISQQFHISSEKILGFCLHRGFKTQEEAIGYLRKKVKNKSRVLSMMIIRLYHPFVITVEKDNLSNEKYQLHKIEEIMEKMFKESHDRKHGILNQKEEEKDIEEIPLLEGEGATNVDGSTTRISNIHDFIKEYNTSAKVTKEEEKKEIFSNKKILDNKDILFELESSENISKGKEGKEIKVIKSSNVFEETEKFSDHQNHALVQFISYDDQGRLLPEPLIIVHGFFDHTKDVEDYKSEFFTKTNVLDPYHPTSLLDLVSIPLNQPCIAWYSRKNVKNLKASKDIYGHTGTIGGGKNKEEGDEERNETDATAERIKEQDKVDTILEKFARLEKMETEQASSCATSVATVTSSSTTTTTSTSVTSSTTTDSSSTNTKTDDSAASDVFSKILEENEE